MIIKDNQGFRVQLQGHLQNFTLLYIIVSQMMAYL